MKHSLSRRAVLKNGLIAGALTPALVFFAGARVRADNIALDPADPAGKALGYVTSSTNPQQNCANCAQYKGAAGSAKGPCAIFPGKDVAAAGYCKAWVKKPA